MRHLAITVGATLVVFCAAPARAADLSVTLEPASASSARGQLKLAEAARGVHITGEITGLTPGRHGFHVHEVGDCSAKDASSAGEHFNPSGKQHGGLKSAERHAGDLGNIEAAASGTAKVDVVGPGLSLAAARADSLRGRTLVVHAQRDDEKTSPAGNSGERVACGVVPR